MRHEDGLAGLNGLAGWAVAGGEGLTDAGFVRVWSDPGQAFHLGRCTDDPCCYRVELTGIAGARIDTVRRQVCLSPLSARATDATLAHFYLDQVLPGLIDRDGSVVLHGGGVVTPAGGLLVVGPTGRGKSTLVAALGLAGHKIQNDDSAILDLTEAGVSMRPIYPGLRLLPESLAALLPPGTATSAVSHYGTKRRVHRPDLLTATPAPLAAILMLTGAPSDAVALTPLPAARLCMDLVGQSMALDPTDLRRAGDRLAQIAQIARRVPGFALSVPRHLSQLPKVCDDLVQALTRHLTPPP